MKSSYLLSGALAGLLGCSHTSSFKGEPTLHISGILKDEVHVRGMFMDTYSFSLNTKKGIKLFNCSGYEKPREMNVVLSPGDEITVVIPKDEQYKDNDYTVCLDNILLLNGKFPPRL